MPYAYNADRIAMWRSGGHELRFIELLCVFCFRAGPGKERFAKHK